MAAKSSGRRTQQINDIAGDAKRQKVWAAAAAIGTSALAANKPESAYVDYERLEPEYFGADALNWWVASLFIPTSQYDR